MEHKSGSNYLQQEMGIDSAEITVSKAFLEFTEVDVTLLRDIHLRLETERHSFSEVFYEHLLRFSEIAPLIGDPTKLEQLKQVQSAYFSQLSEGNYGESYVESRLRVGMIHQRVGLPPKWYIGAYRKYLGEFMVIIFRILDGDVDKYFATYNALLKVVFLDISLALDTYFYTKHQTIVHAKAYAEQLISTMPSGLIVVDSTLKVQLVNNALLRMTALDTVEACIGLSVPKLLGLDEDLTTELLKVLEHGEIYSGLPLLRHDAKGSKYYLATISRVETEEKQMILIFMVQDMTAYHEAAERAQWLAHFDALTGLPNRVLFIERIKSAISIARRNHTQLAVMFLDLDYFKKVNDTHGHHIGDKLLIEVAKRMKSTIREEDTISRLGGDEFTLVLLNIDINNAAHAAEKLLGVFAQHYLIEQHELSITASIGIAMYPGDGQDFESLSKYADIAMYRAKEKGRNNYCFFMPEMQKRAVRTLQLENALRHVLERDQLQLYYQPQMSLEDGRVIGAEALLRWHDPELGVVSPNEFIPITEISGQIMQIGEWVLRSAIYQLKRWMDGGLEPMIVAVNLSAVQFRHANLPELITRILDEAKLPPQYLELELTESVTLGDPLGAIAIMNNLHARGIHISIDDFGTGYSSLNYLKHFQVYKLKIDQSFVNNITENLEDKAIVCAIISMAHSLRMKTIAEGVETEEQLAFLRKQGCNEMQGYYFCKPLPADQFEAFVRSRAKALPAT